MLLASMVIVGIAIIVLSYQQRNPAIMLFANIPALVIASQKGLPFWVGSTVVIITILGIAAAITKSKNWLINSLIVVTNVMAASCVLHAYLAAHVTVFQSVLIAVAIALIVFMVALRDGLWRIPALILAAELYVLAYSIGTDWAMWTGLFILALEIVLGIIFTVTLAAGKSKFFIIAALWFALVCIGLALLGNFVNHKHTPNAAIKAPITSSAHNTWEMKIGNYENGRLMPEGIESMKTAKTPLEAKNAAMDWVDKTKRDPNLLAIAIQHFLGKTVDKSTLSKDGWATDAAVIAAGELELQFMDAIIVAKNVATGHNTGIDSNGNLVRSSGSQISGDTKGVEIKTADGKTTDLLARCGNYVTNDKSIPIGPTDEPLQPKDPSKDVGVNPKVAPWKQDATGGNPAAGHQVSNENGATVSNGVQNDPAADAAIAKAAADKATAEKITIHDKAVADAKIAADATAKKMLADAKTAAEKAAAEKIIADSKTEANNQDHVKSSPPPADSW